MNEAPLPSQSVLRGSLPPPSPRSGARSPTTAPLRASLVACSAEGLAAEMVGACFGNAVLTAWAVELGTNPLVLGALWGLPFIGQIFQAPALWLTAHFGRKRSAVVAHALARQVMLPVAV